MLGEGRIVTDPLKEPASINSIERLKSSIKKLAMTGSKTFSSAESEFEITYSPFTPQTLTEDMKPEKFTLIKTRIADLTKVGLGEREGVYSVTISLLNFASDPVEDREAAIRFTTGWIPYIEKKPDFEALVDEFLDIPLYSETDSSRVGLEDTDSLEAVLIGPRITAHEGLVQNLIKELADVTPIQ